MIEPTTIESFKREYSVNLNNSEFRNVVNELLANNEVDEIVETGAFNGLGSTSVFAETKKYVFSIECNYNNFVNATNNLINYENVCVVHGLSLNRQDLVRGLLNESFDIQTKYDSDYPKAFYMREISHQVVVENALDLFCNNHRKQLVFLDSAGGVGFLEFNAFMNYNKSYLFNKILMLDDISHIKHKRSVEKLEELGYEVHQSTDNRFAWCILSNNKTNP
jgi:hypothetical protein